MQRVLHVISFSQPEVAALFCFIFEMQQKN